MPVLLATTPAVTSYTDYNRLLTDVDNIQNNTSIIPVDSPEQLQLQPDCRTIRGKYSLSTTALTQICGELCPRLIHVIVDIGGLEENPERSQHVGLALSIYNKFVQCRFAQLQNFNILCDVGARRIDGLYSSTSNQLSNRRFVELIDDATKTSDSPIRFHECSTNGRSIILCYTYAKRLIESPEPYYHGFYFSNSELLRSAVKIGVLLVRASTGDRCMTPVPHGRIRHQKNDIGSRVRSTTLKMIGMGDYKYLPHLQEHLPYMQKVSLGLNGLTKEDQTKRAYEIMSKLNLQGISTYMAKGCVYSALYQASRLNKIPAHEMAAARLEWGQRTVYDLFVSIMREARTRSMHIREAVEMVAYKLAMNKFTI